MKLLVDAKRGTAVVPLPGAERLPELLDFAGLRWARKKELHVSVAGSRSRFDPKALEDAGRGIEFKARPSGRFHHVSKEPRRALIELVELQGQEEFCRRLEEKLGKAVPRMPAHVTLFTEPGGGGIGLYSAEELETLSKKADLTLESPWRLDGDGAILGA